MVEEANLRAKSDDDLVAMLKECMRSQESLGYSASERLKRSESAEWDDGLLQEARELLEEAGRLSEQGDLIGKEFERRYGHAALYGDRQFRTGSPRHLEQRWYRKDLTTRTVPQSYDFDEILPPSMENLLSQLPRSWWAHQQSLVSKEQRNAVLQPLLLCGRERWPMGLPALHKFGNYLVVASDQIGNEPFLDTYTAARAIPQICCLGLSLEALKEVKGADSKLRELLRAPSRETDSRIFELLVAAAFARKGHDVAFIKETAQQKTPDLRLYGNPVPMVIECKRRQPLNGYEESEFSVMRKVFALLRAQRKELGLVGELTIDFKQEITGVPAAEIVESIRDITNSLSLYAAKETEWGTIQMRPVGVSQEFERTRLYSPEFLERVFGTDLEVDEFDGICTVADNDRFPEVDRAELPFQLKWISNSPAALRKKLQTIKTLWVEAVDQIPTGETGLIYLAYEEGHRPSLADARTDAIRSLANTIYFNRRAIAVPMTVISRLYPNVLLEGRPDFIASAIPLAEGGLDNYNFWTQEMPTSVFTL